MPNQSKERRFRSEYRSGIDWHIAYEGEGRAEEPIEGYVTGKNGETLVSIAPDANTGAFVLTVTGDERTTFSLFHEALDYVNGRMRREHAHGIGRYPVHRQTGREGLYSLGEMNGKEYIADAFWSDSEPGYINGSLFEIGEGGPSSSSPPSSTMGIWTSPTTWSDWLGTARRCRRPISGSSRSAPSSWTHTKSTPKR